ncbi:MAG: alpha/beta hydrolase [Pseudomonadota bacterium]
MTEFEHMTLVALFALLLGAIASVVFLSTRALPAVGRWMARSLLLVAVGIPLALTSCSPPELGAPVETAEEAPADDVPASTPSSRREAERNARTGSSTQGSRSANETTGRSRGLAPPAPPTMTGPVGTRGLAPGSPGRSLAPAKKSASAAPAQKWDVVPVYYGTDRNAGTLKGPILTYGSDRAKRLELGRALVTVPKVHEVPQIERPWVYRLPFTNITLYEEAEDPAKHFTLREVGSLSRAAFLAFVRERLAQSSAFKDHALIFVHGFNTSFNFALYRTAQLAYDLKFDGAPFVYSWPSQGRLEWYSYDRESAQQSEPYLEQFVKLVMQESGAKTVSIIAHSMGNQPLLRALQNLRRALPDGVKLSQVILAAPDVDRDSFTNLAQQIRPVADGVTLYAHGNDRALDISRRFWGGVPRAGDVPIEGPVILTGLDTIDVTATSSDIFNLNHSGYAENKTLLKDIGLILRTGVRPPPRRVPRLQRVETARGVYWRYPKRDAAPKN